MSETFHFEESGSLAKPGPIGRLFRIFMGALCGLALMAIAFEGNELIRVGLPYAWDWILIGAVALRSFAYVINIGFTRTWGWWPNWILAVLFIAAGLMSYIQYQSVWGPPLGWLALVWLTYVYVHLGLSFVLSGILATPGCEMRAIPHLWSLLRGNETEEHHCPIGPLSVVDRWEARRSEKA